MASVFICFSKYDKEFGKYVFDILKRSGLDVFMSEYLLEPGDVWEEEVWDHLRESEWVFFLASKRSVKSDYMKYEIGGAFFDEKEIIPMIWDINPEDLPVLLQKFEVLDLRGITSTEIETQLKKIARNIHLIDLKLIAIFAGAIWLGYLIFGEK